MSDKETRKEEEEKRKERERERAQVEPIPKRIDFFEWLEKMFYEEPEAQKFPQLIDVTPLSGKRYEVIGKPIMTRVFDKETKPSKVKIVELSNEIVFRTQRDCDIQRRRTVYGVNVKHYAIDPEYYEQWTIECSPTLAHRGDGVPRDGEEEESMEMRYGTQILRHHEKMFELYGEGYTGMLDRYDRDKERDRDEIQRLRKENETLREERERALSLQAERDERLAWTKLKVKGAGELLDTGLALAPHFVNKLIGEPVLPGGETPETITLQKFFKPKDQGGVLTPEQMDAAFGVYGPAPSFEMVKKGALTYAQAQLLFAIAHKKAPVDRLDDFLPGGSLEIAAEQIVELQAKCGFTMEILAPLHLMFESRMRKREAAAGRQATG